VRHRSVSARAAPRPLGRAVLVLLLLLGSAPPANASSRPEPLKPVRPEPRLWGTVTAVSGRELVVETRDRGVLRVRLAGIELPTPAQSGNGHPGAAGQPFGDEALAYARGLLLGKQVMLEPTGKDRQGRLLAVVHLGEININLTLVKEGLAWVRPGAAEPRVRVPLQVAQRQAQVAGYGLWSLPEPEPPWLFRKRHRLPLE